MLTKRLNSLLHSIHIKTYEILYLNRRVSTLNRDLITNV